MREIVFDTETTGFHAEGDDRLVEIGCVELFNRVETGNTYHIYLNPERGMPVEAFNVHGLSEAFLSDKPKFAEKAEEFLAFIGNDTRLVAHNATFDFSFIDAELKRAGYPVLDRDRMVDTIAIARKLHPGAKHSLDALCSRYGIDRSHRVKHGALLDAELLAQLYVELCGGRQIGLGLTEQTTQQEATAERVTPVERVFYAARPHAAHAEELARHAAFVANIPNALWQEAG